MSDEPDWESERKRYRSWPALRKRMADSSKSDEGREAGLWAIDQLQAVFDDQWLDRQTSNDFLSSWFNTVAFSELLDLALRLYLLRNISGIGTVRKDLIKDVRQERRLHSRLVLEVAGLAIQHGFEVALERPYKSGGPPTDVVLTSASGHFGVEVFALLLDQSMQDQITATDLIFSGFGRIESMYGVAISGVWDGVLDAAGTSELLAETDEAASQVRNDSKTRTVKAFGGMLTVTPIGEPSPGQQTLSGPLIRGKNHDRLGPRLVNKTSQAIKAGATWIRVDVLDGLWQLTEWSTWPLKEKGEAIANEVRRAVGNRMELHGVIISSGPAMNQGVLADENMILNGGGFAMRRLLPPSRARETIILPMHDAHKDEATQWLKMYEKEPDWLGWALKSVGLPSSETVLGIRT